MIFYKSIIFIFSFVFAFATCSKEMIIQGSASSILDTFTYSNNGTYSLYKGEGSWTNNLGDYGHIKCMGPIEKNSNYFKLTYL